MGKTVHDADIFLAGLHVGVYSSLDEISKLWQTERRFTPTMPIAEADQLYSGWRDAISRVRSHQLYCSSKKLRR